MTWPTKRTCLCQRYTRREIIKKMKTYHFSVLRATKEGGKKKKERVEFTRVCREKRKSNIGQKVKRDIKKLVRLKTPRMGTGLAGAARAGHPRKEAGLAAKEHRWTQALLPCPWYRLVNKNKADVIFLKIKINGFRRLHSRTIHKYLWSLSFPSIA